MIGRRSPRRSWRHRDAWQWPGMALQGLSALSIPDAEAPSRLGYCKRMGTL
jgi:hypothetical protein